MSNSGTACSLTFSHALTGAIVAVGVGQVAAELVEDTAYCIAVNAAAHCRLYVDDVEIRPTSNGTYHWTPNFYAGRVSVVAVEPSGLEHAFYVDVNPTPSKLSTEQFDAMLEDIRAFDTTLLIGTSAGALRFGREGRSGKFESLIRLVRLRQHGPGFLATVQEIARAPHQFLHTVSQPLPLSRVRRVHPTALQDRRLAGLVAGISGPAESLESMQVLSQAPVLTVDTPANRTVLALLRRFRTTVHALEEQAKALRLGGDAEDQRVRLDRRSEFLTRLRVAAEKLLRSPPFTAIKRAETTAAGLTQIAAHPLYSRAFRRGTEALRLPVEGKSATGHLQVSPSWGVYEIWCFIRTITALENAMGVQLREAESAVAAADFSMAASLADGSTLELLFQAVFPSERPHAHRRAWSLSRERRPDIVLVQTRGDERRYLVLDAKYRSARPYIFDAMASAHIYHDALRIDEKPPERCLLLLPGVASAPWLDDPEFWSSHSVGTLSEFALGGAGLERLVSLLRSTCMAPDDVCLR